MRYGVLDNERYYNKFLGWYLDGESFDFDTIITQNINLIAKWEKE